MFNQISLSKIRLF